MKDFFKLLILLLNSFPTYSNLAIELIAAGKDAVVKFRDFYGDPGPDPTPEEIFKAWRDFQIADQQITGNYPPIE